MHYLQMDIHRVLVLNKNKYLNQQDVWNHLWDLDIVHRDIKKEFMDAFTTMSSTYNDIKMKLMSKDKLYLAYLTEKEENLSFSKTEIDNDLVPEIDKVFSTLVETGDCKDEAIDENGNTLLHYIAQNADLLRGYLNLHNPSIYIKNKKGNTVYDFASNASKSVLDTYEIKLKVKKIEELEDKIVKIETSIVDIQKSLIVYKTDLDILKKTVNKESSMNLIAFVPIAVIIALMFNWFLKN